jgi:hypothetical protein
MRAISARKPLPFPLPPKKHLAEERRKKIIGKGKEKTREVTNFRSVSNSA